MFFAWALFALLLPLVFPPDLRALGAGDPSGVAVVFFLFVSLGTGFGSAVLGIIAGWVGVCRSRGYPELPWAGLALNSALLLVQLVVLILILPISGAGAKWVVVPVIIVAGTVFAALDYGKEFVGRFKPTTDPAPSPESFWFWLLGLACGTGVTVCILGLTRHR
jgi:hypothetical protein